MLKPLTWPPPFITQTAYAGALTIVQIRASGFRSRAGIDAA
jgi:hypothetical protein